MEDIVCWVNMICKDANKVCNWNIYFGCKVVVGVSIPKKGMDGIEDPDTCRVGIEKGNGWRQWLLGAGGKRGGGSIVGISSWLLGSVVIAHNMWVNKRNWDTLRTNDEFKVPILNARYLQDQTNNYQRGIGPPFHLWCLSQ